MHTRHAASALALLLTLTPALLEVGCGLFEDDYEPGVCEALAGEDRVASSRLRHDNSHRFTNVQLADFFPDGLLLSSALLAGDTVGGVRLELAENAAGQVITEVDIDDFSKELAYSTGDGGLHLGPEAFPIVLVYARDDGRRARITIDEQFELTEIEYDLGPLFHYSLGWELDEGAGWSSPREDLCVDGEGDPVDALLLNGRWSFSNGARQPDELNEVTIACREAALAKCVEWAYREIDDDVLGWAHQACTRLVRADYEGTGMTNTYTGARIYIGDTLGFLEQDSYPGWLVKEAEWTPDGASCINRQALRAISPEDCVAGGCFDGVPDCPDPDNLAPSGDDVLVSAISRTEFGATHMLYGVMYEEGVGTHLFYATQEGSKLTRVGVLKDQAGNTGAEIDALFQADFEGLLGFEIDRENQRSRMVGIKGDGTYEVEGGWIEGKVLRGAGVSDEFNRRLVWVLSANTDEICPLWISDGDFPSEILECFELTQAISDHVDLVENPDALDFTVVDGADVWLLELYVLEEEDDVVLGDMTLLSETPRELVGVAMREDEALLVASDVSQGQLVELTGLLGCEESTRALELDIGPGSIGDLAGSPP
ncbi:MAG: hypothetical protein KC468_16275 [Myxococcales bacterium]|nr:hypothetical protein [Myxococcales bacterium]